MGRTTEAIKNSYLPSKCLRKDRFQHLWVVLCRDKEILAFVHKQVQ